MIKSSKLLIIKSNKIKQLSVKLHSFSGRNNSGKIMVRGRGGSNYKKKFKLVDFNRFYWNIPGLVLSIHYDPYRRCLLALVVYITKVFSYILLPEELFPGDLIISGERVKIKIGNSLLLKNIPLNIPIHNIEIKPGNGGRLFRSSGCWGFLISKSEKIARILKGGAFLKVLRKPKEFRLSVLCSATIGKVSNKEQKFLKLKKAGDSRNRNFRSKVRGVAKNPSDHPHGGGEGKKSSKKVSMSPWRKLGKGVPTKKNDNKKKLKRKVY